MFPFWFSGCDRKDEGYWGFFPFYGHHPHGEDPDKTAPIVRFFEKD